MSPVSSGIMRCKKSAASQIDDAKDSLRIYNLGNSYKTRIEHYGAKQPYSPDAPMIF
jgi:CRISPR-associated protein Cas2